jgi:hypothetical protein
MIESIEPTVRFHKKSYATVASGCCAQAGIIDPGYSEAMNYVDESVRETE